MGGSSSKSAQRRSKTGHVGCDATPEVSRSALSNSSEGAKGNKKKAKKGNVKIAKEAKKRKSDKGSKRGRSGSSHLSDSIIFLESHTEPQSPVYRKKSSCPSCEAKELYNASNRGRSGSEKSLRYSDFNKVQRKTRIYDWELSPINIPLYGVAEPVGEDTCYVCGVYTGRLIRNCRVCLRAFHDGCLAKIGHGLTDAARALLRKNAWSCHQCVSLNHVLTQEEVRSVTDIFEHLGLDKDNITSNSYLAYCQHTMEQESKDWTLDELETCAHRFQAVDKLNRGVITWTQFLNLESIRILRHRCKDSLVRLLTQAELAEARRLFQSLDSEKTGFTVKRSVDGLLDCEKRPGTWYYPEDTKMYVEKELDSLVSWSEFLRDRAIYILAKRANLRLGDQQEDDVIADGATTPSFESIDEPSSHVRSRSGVDSSNDQLSSLDISTSILDDLTSELDKRCSQNAEGEQTNSGVNDGQKSADQSLDGQEKQGNMTNIPASNPVQENTSPLQPAGLESNKSRRSGVSAPPGYRRSEVIPTSYEIKNVVQSGRQTKCKSVQLGQAYGGLVEKIQLKEWKC